jgi:L-alanine-DL-glutamate epimerase-like enolase superfamily enzyme
MARDQASRKADVGHGDGDVAPHRSRRIERVALRVCRVPTIRRPETDGTAAWDTTTIVIVELHAGGATGLGYSYIDAAAATVIRDLLEPCILGADAFAIPAAMTRMVQAVRNHGRAGLVACAISAVDIALWDLKARLLDVPLAELLGCARATVPVYASGGFTSTPPDELAAEVAAYAAAGHRRIKLKIGRDAALDRERLRAARAAAGPAIDLMVDANGAYAPKQALAIATDLLCDLGVVYFEEPVSSDDVAGLRLVREHAPPIMAIAAGEYLYDADAARTLLAANAVDILQADVTRCLGITGFLHIDALCEAHHTPLSSHCAPALHAHAAAASRRLIHVEHFFDHVRLESLLFDGAPVARQGTLSYDPTRAGHGLSLRLAEAVRFG